MINISRSPLRISFFGGGTDYPMYFHDNPGAVLGASIDKYIYTIALPMADFAEHRYRITYRIVEGVDRVEDIKHNVIRATLLDMRYDKPLNVAIISDLPGNSGLGSSSSFTVGFIALMEHLSGRSITKFDLFKRAVRTERDLLKENVGIQDQIHAAFGGLNLYHFHKEDFTIRPAQMATECREALDRSLCLVYTGIQRHASTMVQEQLKNTEEKKISKDLSRLVELCHEGIAVLEGREPGQHASRPRANWSARDGRRSAGSRPPSPCRRSTRPMTKRCASAPMAANCAAREAAASCCSWRPSPFRRR